MTENIPLPPGSRTTVWNEVNTAAISHRFVLPVCEDCQTVLYPPREVCSECLGDELQWQDIDAIGKVIGTTTLHVSTSDFFRAHIPLHVGLIKLDCGPVVYAHMSNENIRINSRVTLVNRPDKSGNGVFIAVREGLDPDTELKNLEFLLMAD